MKKIPLFIMSMKSSPRLPNLLKKMKKFNLKYKIFYGLTGKNKNEIKKVYSMYDEKKVIERTGRPMGFNEIGSQYTATRILKYCLKKKFKNIIIMSDDFIPSSLFKEWVEKKIYFNGNKIIGFQCFPPGFLKKKYTTVLDGKVKIHEAKTHVFNSGFNQITLGFIKKFLKITNGGKAIGNGDYPFDFRKHNMTIFQTIPFLAYPDDKGFSYLAKDRDKLEKTLFKNFRKTLYKFFGIKFINKIFNFLRIPYYILFVPFLFRKYKNLDYYTEYYFEKYFYKLINPIFKRYIDIEDIYSLKSSYAKDLKKYANYRVFDK
jgi:GR25 family glycosyltransferase involved in LPS biosynthesis